MTDGVCPEAFERRTGPRASTVELVMRGRRIMVPTSENRKRHRRPNDAKKLRRKHNEKAKHAARLRLAAMFPDLFDVLLAEERAERGLEPWPVENAARSDRNAEVELGFAELFAELETRGVDVA